MTRIAFIQQFCFIFGFVLGLFCFISSWGTVTHKEYADIEGAVEDAAPKIQKKIRKSPEISAELRRMAHEISERHGFVLLTMVNFAYSELLNNFLCNVEPMGLHERILVVATDSKTCHFLSTRHPKVNCGQILIPKSGEHELDAALSWGKHAYVDFLTVRACLLAELLVKDHSLSLVLFETDATWFRNPIGMFEQALEEAVITVPVKGYPDRALTLSFNPMVVNSTFETRRFFAELEKRLLDDETLYDQDVFDGLCKQQFAGVVCRQFAWEEVGDGLWYKLSDRVKATMSPYIVNNNFYVGVNNKITRQALNGFWFVGSRDKGCDTNRTVRFLKRHENKTEELDTA